MESRIYSVTPTIRWRDILDVQITHPNLKRRVEGFLDVLEKSAFPYGFRNEVAGEVEARFLSGQEILSRIVAVKDAIGPWRAAHPNNPSVIAFEDTSVIKHGKFTIEQNDAAFDAEQGDGTQSKYLGHEDIGAYPMGMQIIWITLKVLNISGSTGSFIR